MVHTFSKGFSVSKMAREIGQKPGEDVVWQRNAGRRQPPPQAHFTPNPPRHSCRSVSDGVIQLRVLLAGCAGFFLQVSIPRRILTKMSGAIAKHALCKAVVEAPVLLNLLPATAWCSGQTLRISTVRSVYCLCIGLLRFVVENSKNLACSCMEREKNLSVFE